MFSGSQGGGCSQNGAKTLRIVGVEAKNGVQKRPRGFLYRGEVFGRGLYYGGGYEIRVLGANKTILAQNWEVFGRGSWNGRYPKNTKEHSGLEKSAPPR